MERTKQKGNPAQRHYSTMCNGSCFFCNFWNVLASKSPSCFPLGTRGARVYLLIPFTHWSKKSSTSHSLAILSWLFLSSQETLYLKISEMPEQIPDISLTQSTCLNLVWVQVEQVTLTEARERRECAWRVAQEKVNVTWHSAMAWAELPHKSMHWWSGPQYNRREILEPLIGN